MATIKQGTLTKTPSIVGHQRHLRPFGKRLYWKIERRKAKRCSIRSARFAVNGTL